MTSIIKHKLGFWQATSLVLGNMIGSGIFLLPLSLSVYGQYSLLGWAASTIGALLLAYIFSRLIRLSTASGGPYIYTRLAFGNTAAFSVAWGYWLCIITGNAAIAIACTANLVPFFDVLGQNNFMAACCSIAIIWLLTIVNLLSVKIISRVQVYTTIVKIIPLLLIIICGTFYFEKQNLVVPPTQNINAWQAMLATASLTLWSFLGLESASIPTQFIAEPQKNAARATIAGTAFAAIVFVSSCTLVIGILPKTVMLNSTAPYADAAKIIAGNDGYYLVAVASFVACFGALNGWILLQGQMPLAAAKDNLLPKYFAKTNSNQLPANGLIISSFIATVLIIFNYDTTLQTQFKNMILLSTLATLIPYAFCALAEITILIKNKTFSFAIHYPLLIISIVAFLFSLAAIFGTGFKTIVYGMALIAVGMVVYFLMKIENKQNDCVD